MRPSLVLVHSPFLGPASWQPAAVSLAAAGWDVRVPSLLAVAESAPPFWPAGVEAIGRAADEAPVVLVPHSNAGLYVPAVVASLGEQVRGVVFVDAALPGAGHHTTPEFLRRLATTDGRLPPWTSWWPDDAVDELFPDAATRARIEAEQPRMPLAYYEHLPPAPAGWDALPCRYLWFGEPYDRGAAEAEARGWPVRHLTGTHLQMLVDPDAVAGAVTELAEGLA